MPEIAAKCGGQPILVKRDELCGDPGKTEYQQSYWWARAFATYRSDAHEKQGSPVVSLTLSKLGSTAISYGLGGTATSYPNFDGATLTGVRLAPHEISIFEIMP